MCNDLSNGYSAADPDTADLNIVSNGCHFIVARLSTSNTMSCRQNHSWGNKSAIANEPTCTVNRNQPRPLRYAGCGPTQHRWRRRWEFTVLHAGDLAAGIANEPSVNIEFEVPDLILPIRSVDR